jgi:hypothetical protein
MISSLLCCEIAERLREDTENFIHSFRNGDIASSQILLVIKHITECCGYGDFFEDLAKCMGKDKAGLISHLSNNHQVFLLYLGAILKKDLRDTELYDRLYNCIPLMGKLLSTSRELSEYGRCHKIFGDVVDVEMLKDFAFCVQGIEYFRKLFMIEVSYDFLVSHPEGIVAEDGPFTFCANTRYESGELIRDFSLDIPVEDGYIASIHIHTAKEQKIEGLAGELSRYYTVDLCNYYARTTEDGYLPPFRRICRFPLNRHYGGKYMYLIYIPADEIGAMFDLAYRQGCPVYICRKRVWLSSKSSAKSAKK